MQLFEWLWNDFEVEHKNLQGVRTMRIECFWAYIFGNIKLCSVKKYYIQGFLDDPLSKYCNYKNSFFIGLAVLGYLPKPRKLWN